MKPRKKPLPLVTGEMKLIRRGPKKKKRPGLPMVTGEMKLIEP